MRVLVVEDDRGIAGLISRGLEAESHSVTCAHDAAEGEARALSGDFALVLLDVMLPGGSGLDVLSSIREREPGLPVIVITALGESEEVIRGLDLGADDYVVKPFALDELLARVRARLRGRASSAPGRLEVGDIVLDLRTRKVERKGDDVRLTAREFDLLAYLMRHPGQVLSRAQILNSVWGYDYDPGTNVVEVYVGYLRRKLASVDGPAPIETVRSAGYRLIEADA